jgi:membrane protease YdiL (CAAX protease family)
MNTRTDNQSLVSFFIWIVIFSVPFWLMGMMIQVELPIKLPLSALMAFNPMIVALIFTYRAEGMVGVKALLGRIFDFKRIQQKKWYAVIFLFMPIIASVEFAIIVLFRDDITDVQLPILVGIPMFLLFFIAACGEELGWQAYGYDRLSNGRSALEAGIILGVIWAVWHVIPYIQTSDTLIWVFWQCMVTILLRILIVWVYVNTGKSAFSAIVFHAMINVSAFLFPNYGSYYDPFVATLVVGVAVLVIVAVWGRTLTTP